MEASELSIECREDVNISDLEEVLKKLSKAERILNLRIQLGFKYIHQLDAAETMFTLAMLAGDVEKAKSVAVLGERMALVRCGEGKVVEEWRRRKADTLLYLLG